MLQSLEEYTSMTIMKDVILAQSGAFIILILWLHSLSAWNPGLLFDSIKHASIILPEEGLTGTVSNQNKTKTCCYEGVSRV